MHGGKGAGSFRFLKIIVCSSRSLCFLIVFVESCWSIDSHCPFTFKYAGWLAVELTSSEDQALSNVQDGEGTAHSVPAIVDVIGGAIDTT